MLFWIKTQVLSDSKLSALERMFQRKNLRVNYCVIFNHETLAKAFGEGILSGADRANIQCAEYSILSFKLSSDNENISIAFSSAAWDMVRERKISLQKLFDILEKVEPTIDSVSLSENAVMHYAVDDSLKEQMFVCSPCEYVEEVMTEDIALSVVNYLELEEKFSVTEAA